MFQKQVITDAQWFISNNYNDGTEMTESTEIVVTYTGNPNITPEMQ